jgi:hypothetical protein
MIIKGIVGWICPEKQQSQANRKKKEKPCQDFVDLVIIHKSGLVENTVAEPKLKVPTTRLRPGSLRHQIDNQDLLTCAFA